MKIRWIRSIIVMTMLFIVLLNSGVMNQKNVNASQSHLSSDIINVSLLDHTDARYVVSDINVGWNLGDSFDSKVYDQSRGYDLHLNQETLWGNPEVSRELINRVATCGFNTIRIPVTWYYNTGVDENGRLVVGKQWLARVAEVVQYALDNDMYVILNSHHDQKLFYAGVSDEEFNNVLNNAADLWTQIAFYFKDCDSRLMFEGFNEIDNMEKYWQYGDRAAVQMNQLNQIFVNSVRNTGGNNVDRNLIIPTLLHGSSKKFLNGFQLPTDCVSNHLIVAVHNYDQKLGQDVDKNFEILEDFSNKIGAPIIITEMGNTTDYQVIERREEHAANYIARAAEHHIKCVWWDNGYEYAIVGRKSDSETKASMIQALMDGCEGKKSEVNHVLSINDSGYYELKMPNLSNGIIETQYWGTITTKEMIPITGGRNYLFYLYVDEDASDIWIQRILFYDARGKYICGTEVQKKDYLFTTPDGAATMKVSMNSPYRNISWDEYQNYIENGLLNLSLELYE